MSPILGGPITGQREFKFKRFLQIDSVFIVITKYGTFRITLRKSTTCFIPSRFLLIQVAQDC